MRIDDINQLDPKFRSYVDKMLDLINLYNLPFKIFETRRTFERQKELVKNGYSKTYSSKHIDGLAVDFVLFIDGKWNWDKKYYYDFLGALIKDKLGDDIKWGGNFKSFYDGPHFEYNIIKI